MKIMSALVVPFTALRRHTSLSAQLTRSAALCTITAINQAALNYEEIGFDSGSFHSPVDNPRWPICRIFLLKMAILEMLECIGGNKMRPSISILVPSLTLLVISTGCRVPEERAGSRERVETRTLELKSGGQLFASTFNGSVSVEGWDREEVSLVAKIRERREGDVRFTAEYKDGRVEIIAEREEQENRRNFLIDFGKSNGVSYTLRIPRNTMTTLVSSNGRMEISQIDNEISAATSNGSITADRIGAKARLTTSNSSIRANSIKGELIASTSNGSIEASDVKGYADLKSSNGSIHAKNIESDLVGRTSNGRFDVMGVQGNADLRTSSGRVEIRNVKGKADAVTSNGSIIAENIGTDLTIINSNGRIDVRDIKGNADLRTSNGTIEIRNVKGKTDVVTSSGSILAENIESDLVGRTSNGRIDINRVLGAIDLSASNAPIKAAELNGNGRGIRLITTNGGINVTLGQAQGVLEARTSRDRSVVIENPTIQPTVDGSVTRAKIGSSDQPIDLRTTNGRITVR